MDDVGTSGDITDIQIRCECKQSRLLSEAVETGGHHKAGALGLCNGSQPWLGPFANARCEQPSRFLIRTASNAYFPQKLAAISLPPRNESVSKAVEQAWVFLEAVESMDDVVYERKKDRVARVLEGISNEEVWEEIQRRRNPVPESRSRLKPDELKTLIACEEERGEDRPDGDFYARVLPKSVWDAPWMNCIQQVVLVHRRDSLRSEKILQDRLFKNPKVTVIWDHVVDEILGEKTPAPIVTGARLRNVQTGAVRDVRTDGFFVAIGHSPNTELFKGKLEMDGEGYLITRPDSTATNIEGVYAAGDVQDKVFRQAVTAAGTGCMAALEAEKWLAGQETRQAEAAE
jgi:hypothetical protein